jgi:hypothetical protein
LSVFNLILGLFIIINFSELNSLKIIEFLFTSMEFFIPVAILEYLQAYFNEFGNYLKSVIKNFIDWVYDIKTEKPVNLPEKGVDTKNPFLYRISKDEIIDMSQLEYKDILKDENSGINWWVVLGVTFISIGISYYFIPEFYHSIYNSLFPPRDPGSGGGANFPFKKEIEQFRLDKGKGKEMEPLPINIYPSGTILKTLYSPEKIGAKIAKIIEAPWSPEGKRLAFLEFYDNVVHPRNCFSPKELEKRLEVLHDGKTFIDHLYPITPRLSNSTAFYSWTIYSTHSDRHFYNSLFL